MHTVSIPQKIIDRGRALRGGKDHIFDRLDMSRVAHVIVDLQNGFCQEGAPVEVPVTREIFGTVNSVSEAVRQAGGTNVFLRYTTDANEPQPWNVWFDTYTSQDQTKIMFDAFSRGAHHWQLCPEVDVTPDDLVIDKTRFSAMIPGTCQMDEVLKARGIDTLIISGTLTNCCCESTARDALQMGYKVIFLTDTNATLTDEEHNATLMSMSAIFADVMDSAYLMRLIEKSQTSKAA